MPSLARIKRPAKALFLKQIKSKLDGEFSRHLLDIIDTKAALRPSAEPVSPIERQRLRSQLESLATRTLRKAWQRDLTPGQRRRVVEDVLEERVGFGPLEPLMKDPQVSEIMVNGPSTIFVERRGCIERTTRRFRDEEHLMGVIERILASSGREISMGEPYVDAYLPEGFRVNVAVAPIAQHGPVLTIRKFNRTLSSLEQLIRLGTLTPQAEQFLRLCVRGRLNILISGPASAGKTTLMNALANVIPAEERVVILEEYPELDLPSRHVVRLETRPPNAVGRKEVTLRELLRYALHLRPDRILLGEVRGAEALDMLQAMNVGHDGSMVTLHANAPPDVLHRITTLALLGLPELSLTAATWQFYAAVNLVVHLERMADGSRRVTNISATHRDAASGGLTDIFTLTQDAAGAWVLLPTGERPQFLDRLARRDVVIPDDVFS